MSYYSRGYDCNVNLIFPFAAAFTLVLGMGIVTVMNTLPSKLVPVDELGNF